jgi:hypothetical protein
MVLNLSCRFNLHLGYVYESEWHTLAHEQFIKSLVDLNRALMLFPEARMKRELSVNEFLVKTGQATQEDKRNI